MFTDLKLMGDMYNVNIMRLIREKLTVSSKVGTLCLRAPVCSRVHGWEVLAVISLAAPAWESQVEINKILTCGLLKLEVYVHVFFCRK